MGVVYKAYQVGMDREVALKLLSPELASDKSFIERFFREARAAARLHHPNIVQAYDGGVADGVHYLALEYVDGESLRTILERDGRLPPALVLDYAKQVCGALAAAHDAGIIHRDIKPDNLLVDRHGVIRVMDFGLAKAPDRDGALTMDGQIMGTPIYLSPEIAAGEEVDCRSDLYSLGVTLFHLLAGRPPFQGKQFSEIVVKHASQAPPPLSSLAPTVDRRLCRIIDRLLRKSPDDRHADALELLADLESLGDVSVPAGGPRGKQGGAGRMSPSTRKLLTGLLAGILLLAGAVAWRRLHSPDPPPVRAPKPVVLFDGQTLGNWEAITEFSVPLGDGSGLGGSVFVEDGAIVLEPGSPLTGAAWSGPVPRIDYEIAFEACRISGDHDFCLAFPVHASMCMLQAGGWQSDLLGLDVLDGLHPPENGTGQNIPLEPGEWHAIRLRVTETSLRVRFDERDVIDLPIAGHMFELDPKWQSMKPLGIGSAWGTRAAFRNISLREVPGAGSDDSGTTVLANADWTPTGQRIGTGQGCRLESYGVWGSRPGELVGPGGSGEIADDPFPLPGAAASSLIGRIGVDGKAFHVGTGVTISSDATGELFLRMNDHTPDDNRGSVRVVLTHLTGQG